MATTPEEWTRYALTGNKAATSPSNADIAGFKEISKAEILRDYPCIAANMVPIETDPETLPAFSMWLGYQTALLMDEGGFTPTMGSELTLVEVKSGDVTEKYSKAGERNLVGPAGWLAVIQRAKGLLPCVAAQSYLRRDGVLTGGGVAGFRRSEIAKGGCDRWR